MNKIIEFAKGTVDLCVKNPGKIATIVVTTALVYKGASAIVKRVVKKNVKKVLTEEKEK